jgi:glycosyltransferase involved in cell wall biosynthesis
MHVVPLGINPDGLWPTERAPRARAPFIVGYFARVAPEKGLDRLAEAYRVLRRTGTLGNARLEAAGYLAPEHRPYLQRIEHGMREAGLGDEFFYRGTMDREGKARFLRNLDVLSVPGPYNEPKGLPVLEALACGVPVVQPRRGAFPEIIETTGGGLLVDPETIDALAEGIATMARDPDRARELGRRGATAVREHYTAAKMADRALEVFRQVSGRHATASVVSGTERGDIQHSSGRS